MNSSISLQTTSDGSWGLAGASSLLRYPPEPRHTAGGWARAAGSAVGNVATALLNTAGGVSGDLGLQNLIQEQIRVQLQMQIYSAQSNILRSQHETEMTPIRNMRLG